MKPAPATPRGFRLPRLLDAATRAAAAAAGVSQTAIVVRVLADAIRRGDLPSPTEPADIRQLEFL